MLAADSLLDERRGKLLDKMQELDGDLSAIAVVAQVLILLAD